MLKQCVKMDGYGHVLIQMDFSYYAERIPGCFFFVGSSPSNKKLRSVPHHCSHFDIDENALLIGSSIFVQLIEDQLINTL